MFIDFREGKREQGGGRETVVWERNTDWLPPVHALTRDQTHHLGTCSDGEPILQPFGAWDAAATNRATWPGPMHIILMIE